MNRKDQLFQELIREKLPILRAGVCRIVHNPQDTDDIIQEALLKAYRKFNLLKGEENLAGWVYRIAINEAYDFLRKRERNNENVVECEQEKLEAIASTSDKPSEQDEKVAALERAIQRLPEETRQVIVIACLSELSGSEAAKYLECTENTLYQRVHRAKRELKELVMKEVENER